MRLHQPHPPPPKEKPTLGCPEPWLSQCERRPKPWLHAHVEFHGLENKAMRHVQWHVHGHTGMPK